METIINNSELQYLKLNNAITLQKKITKEMLKMQNMISINLDIPKLPNDKILCIYWRFHNFETKIKAISIDFENCFPKNKFNEKNYYTLVQPYDSLPNNINDNIDESKQIFMYTFVFNCTHVFDENYTYVNFSNITLNILTDDNVNESEFNNDSSIEFVVQYKLNPNNLPNDLEKIKIYKLSMVFENLPINLKKIEINEDCTNELIMKYFPKIPLGCEIINQYGIKINNNS